MINATIIFFLLRLVCSATGLCLAVWCVCVCVCVSSLSSNESVPDDDEESESESDESKSKFESDYSEWSVDVTDDWLLEIVGVESVGYLSH